MTGDPIDFGRVALAVWGWLSSPTTVILLSLSYLAYTLARIASTATAPTRKDDEPR